MNALYTFLDLRQSFGGREVLHIPRLSLAPGKICAFTGPNGAGKTTLMRIMAFLDAPGAGEIFFRGAKILPEQRAALRGRVVWVSQFPVLFSGTLLYNVEYPLRLQGIPRTRGKQRALELLELVGLRHLAGAPARRLSGGESQRACVARALAAGAEVLLFDEPTANVDHHARGEFIRIVRELWEEEKLSVFITTHDHDLVASLCRERLSLFDGKLVHPEALPVRGGALPDFAAPLPAKLRRHGGALTIIAKSADNSAQDDGEGAFSQGSVVALGADAEGICLRVRLDGGGTEDFLLSDKEEAETARGIALESRIQVLR